MELAAYVCSHVFKDALPILFVSRADGDWQCLCGGQHDPDEVPRVVGLNHLMERDPTLAELRDLPEEWEAERANVGGAWIKAQIEPDN
jgi:hypothetical protein